MHNEKTRAYLRSPSKLKRRFLAPFRSQYADLILLIAVLVLTLNVTSSFWAFTTLRKTHTHTRNITQQESKCSAILTEFEWLKTESRRHSLRFSAWRPPGCSRCLTCFSSLHYRHTRSQKNGCKIGRLERNQGQKLLVEESFFSQF